MKSAFLLLLATVLASIEVGPVPVLRVIDGDTIVVAFDGEEESVRLLHVDTPESKDNDHGKAMDEGKKAKEFLTALLPAASHVYLKGPGKKLERDRYKRLLAIVERHLGTDGTPVPVPAPNEEVRTSIIKCVNAEIIRAGWSPYWMKYGLAADPYDGSFRLAQNEADKEGVGLWGSNLKWIQDKANERTAPKKEK